MLTDNHKSIAPPLLMKSAYWGQDIDSLLDSVQNRTPTLRFKLLTQKRSNNNAYMAVSEVNKLQLAFIRYGSMVEFLSQIDDSYIFVINFGGKCSIKLNNLDLCTNQQVTLLPPKSNLEHIYSADCGHLILRFLPDKHHDQLFAPLFDDCAMHCNPKVNEAIYNLCRHFLQKCEYAETKASVRERVHSLKQELYQVLANQTVIRNVATTEALLTELASSPVSAAIDFIKENPQWDYSIESLTQLLAVSRRTLYDQFKRHTGTTPYRYYKNFKLGLTRLDLLKYGNKLSITEIASSHGFTHLGRFSSEYRKVFGELPTQTVQLISQQRQLS